LQDLYNSEQVEERFWVAPPGHHPKILTISRICSLPGWQAANSGDWSASLVSRHHGEVFAAVTTLSSLRHETVGFSLTFDKQFKTVLSFNA